MKIGDIKLRIMVLALPALIWLSGCASPDATRTAEDAQLQAADTRQVIVVPIFIVSPPQDGNRGGKTMPEPGSPDQTTSRWEPRPAVM